MNKTESAIYAILLVISLSVSHYAFYKIGKADALITYFAAVSTESKVTIGEKMYQCKRIPVSE